MAENLKAEYNRYKEMRLSIDISRGKPCREQLELSMEMLNTPIAGIDKSGFDCRNYGVLDGIPEMKELFSSLLGVEYDEVFVGGNSSLNLMYDVLSKFMLYGVGEGKKPWKDGKVKFLCPCPGYDRHFTITESLGIEMINIPMYSDGPDVEMIKKYAESDESVKGMWCVPMYSNPGGITYSDEKVRAIASLKPKAEDFRVFWDNAYFLHHLEKKHDVLLNIFEECKKFGNSDMVYEFCSTSKISLPGAGVSAFATSKDNLRYMKKLFGVQTIGYDKLNQLRHASFFKTPEDVYRQMEKHAEIIRPKFLKIEEGFDILQNEGHIKYHKPTGGYFLSVDLVKASAKRVVELCKEAGLKLTDAGSSFPYHKDPEDKNIRIAPTYIDIKDIPMFLKLFTVCVKLAEAEK